MLGAVAATALGGVVMGTAVGDMLGAVPVAVSSPNIPGTNNDATPRKTSNGTIVSTTNTPRQTLMMSAAIVLVAMVILVFGDRILKDARIG